MCIFRGSAGLLQAQLWIKYSMKTCSKQISFVKDSRNEKLQGDRSCQQAVGVQISFMSARSYTSASTC